MKMNIVDYLEFFNLIFLYQAKVYKNIAMKKPNIQEIAD